MHKRRVATTLLIAGTFSTGFVITQIAGSTPSFAAAKKHATTKTHVTSKKHTTGTTTKRVAGSGAHKHAAGSAATPHADGSITAVTTAANGDTVISVKADTDPSGSPEYSGVTTIVLNGSTKYDAGKGTSTTTKPTFTVGQNIAAEGTVSSDGKTLTATQVDVHAHGGGRGGPGHGGGGPHADGTVLTSNVNSSGGTVTVTPDTDPAGSNEYTKVTTILITSSTQYDAGKGSTSTTQPAIATGNYISAEGTLSSDGKTLTATHVSIRSSAPGGH